MPDESRLPKFNFNHKLRVYGELDISQELIVCEVDQERLKPIYYPDSWENAITAIDLRITEINSKKLHPRNPPCSLERPVLMGLNESEDGYEIIYDPYDQGGNLDPQMLLNFRRKI